jgi:hypothetical protein
MSKVRSILFCLLLAFALSAGAAETNSFVWHKPDGRMDAAEAL